MAPAKLYPGPMGLGRSIHATPTQEKAVLAVIPAAVSSDMGEVIDRTIATKDQIAATTSSSDFALVTQNADAELAVAQGNSLKKEVDKHAAKLTRTMSSTMTNMRRLLELIRESLQGNNVADMKTLEELWAELEQLFAAANEAKLALPAFLQKQSNNMSLYHASMMNEMIRDTQQEVEIQYKKVNVQHNLILEHQEAFQNYKAQATAKIEELEGLQERVSRLTLEKGNFRTEVHKYKQLLEQEKSTKDENLHIVDFLQKEHEALTGANGQLLLEIDTLGKSLSDLQAKMTVVEQQIADCSAAELKTQADALAREIQKTKGLTSEISMLKSEGDMARMEIDQMKLENKSINEKYKLQSTEYTSVFKACQFNTNLKYSI